MRIGMKGFLGKLKDEEIPKNVIIDEVMAK